MFFLYMYKTSSFLFCALFNLYPSLHRAHFLRRDVECWVDHIPPCWFSFPARVHLRSRGCSARPTSSARRRPLPRRSASPDPWRRAARTGRAWRGPPRGRRRPRRAWCCSPWSCRTGRTCTPWRGRRRTLRRTPGACRRGSCAAWTWCRPSAWRRRCSAWRSSGSASSHGSWSGRRSGRTRVRRRRWCPPACSRSGAGPGPGEIRCQICEIS